MPEAILPVPKLIGIYGPTGSGKSDFAEALAMKIDAQLINCDAFQVYRGLDIGTAKSDNKNRYDLIDILDPSETFGVGEWIRRSIPILERLFVEGRSAVVVGGTMYYMRALLDRYDAIYPLAPAELRQAMQERLERDGIESVVAEVLELDPDADQTVDLANPVRVTRHLERLVMGSEPVPVDYPPFSVHKFGLSPADETLLPKLLDRTQRMLASGWIEEVQQLLERPMGRMEPAMRAIGYQTVADLAEGKIDLEDAVDRIWTETKNYVKRQRTWMRSEAGLVTLREPDDPHESDEARTDYFVNEAMSFL